MSTLTVRLSTVSEGKARFVATGKHALAGRAVEASPTLDFGSYDDMHRILAPSRLTIVKALAGQGALSIREVARRVGRDVQAVRRDVTTLINAGVVDRTDEGIDFPYARIHFEFDVSATAWGSVRTCPSHGACGLQHILTKLDCAGILDDQGLGDVSLMNCCGIDET